MFAQHQNLSDHINGNIIRSEIEGGVDSRQLPPKSTLQAYRNAEPRVQPSS